MLQLCFNNNSIKYNFINVYNVYNSLLNNYNKIINKNNFLAIKLTLRIQDESIIVKKFNFNFFLSELFLF